MKLKIVEVNDDAIKLTKPNSKAGQVVNENQIKGTLS